MSLLELSVFDPDHQLLRRFLAEGKTHLNFGGRMLLNYSTTHGDVGRMRSWAQELGWTVTKLKEKVNDYISVELYELVPTNS
jgi:hypothetical protein